MLIINKKTVSLGLVLGLVLGSGCVKSAFAGARIPIPMTAFIGDNPQAANEIEGENHQGEIEDGDQDAEENDAQENDKDAHENDMHAQNDDIDDKSVDDKEISEEREADQQEDLQQENHNDSPNF